MYVKSNVQFLINDKLFLGNQEIETRVILPIHQRGFNYHDKRHDEVCHSKFAVLTNKTPEILPTGQQRQRSSHSLPENRTCQCTNLSHP